MPPPPFQSTDATNQRPRRLSDRVLTDRTLRWGEGALIVILFFVVAGTAPPSINEAHYLTKAKHYWNPEWCGRDQFLNSADAHLAFCWTIGWLTRWWTLSQAAWFGRFLGWCLLASGWCALGRSLVLRPGWTLLTAALAVSGWHFANLSGEWVVGGVEGKVFSYAFVLFGLAALARGHWRVVWWWFGTASALHVLVGGWSVLAAGIVWLTTDRTCRPTFRQLLPHMAGGFALALVGLVPTLALTWNVPHDVARQAAEIYVWVRLPHHLLPHFFLASHIAWHAALALTWLGILGWSYDQLDAANRRVQRFVAAAMGIALMGLAIHTALVFHPEWMAGILRFYWFRLSDAMLPVGVSMALAATLQVRDCRATDRKLAIVLVLVAVAISTLFLSQRPDRRPLAEGRHVTNVESDTALRTYRDWLEVCQWFRESTPYDSLVLTPSFIQTFKWHAQRAEVYNWKHMAQDAKGIVEWSQRRNAIEATRLYHQTGRFDQVALNTAIARYKADYIVVDRRQRDVSLGLPLFRNASYAVYRGEDGHAKAKYRTSKGAAFSFPSSFVTPCSIFDIPAHPFVGYSQWVFRPPDEDSREIRFFESRSRVSTPEKE